MICPSLLRKDSDRLSPHNFLAAPCYPRAPPGLRSVSMIDFKRHATAGDLAVILPPDVARPFCQISHGLGFGHSRHS